MKPDASICDAPKLGRPRGFDRDEALYAIIGVFRRKGYEATTLSDLCEAAGLSRSSFYAAFGSKREALLEAVRAYADAGRDQARGLIEAAPTARDGALAVVAAMAGAPLPAGGCFVVNCVSELAQADPEAAAILRRHFALTEGMLAELLAPETPESALPLAAALLALAVGALTLRKAGLGEGEVLAAAELLIDRFAEGAPAVPA